MSKDRESSKVAPSSTKGMVIQEKWPKEEAPDTSPTKKGKVDDSNGKKNEIMLLPDAKKAKSNKMAGRTTCSLTPEEGTSARPSHPLGPKASVMASYSMAEKILARMVLSVNRERVEKLGLDQVVTKFSPLYWLGIHLFSFLALVFYILIYSRHS